MNKHRYFVMYYRNVTPDELSRMRHTSVEQVLLDKAKDGQSNVLGFVTKKVAEQYFDILTVGKGLLYDCRYKCIFDIVSKTIIAKKEV